MLTEILCWYIDSDASQYAQDAKNKANEGMDKTKQTAKDYMPNQAGDH